MSTSRETLHPSFSPYHPMDLPDEILDLVFQAIDTTPSEEPTPEIAVKWTWQACALVSRRWYNIVIPHLFRSITVGYLAPEFATALACSPFVATLVREVFLCGDIDVQVLDRILKGLPYIRLLKAPADTEICDPDPDYIPFLSNHVIEVLQYGNHDITGWPEAYGPFRSRQVTRLLNLFSQIEHLDISLLQADAWDFNASPATLAALVRSEVAVSRREGLEVRKLSCGSEGASIRFIPRYLLYIGACKHLTVLKYELQNSHDITGLCDLLVAVKDTLKIFWIHDFPEYYWGNDGNDIGVNTAVDLYIHAWSRGLPACISLEEFQLVVVVDTEGDGERIREHDEMILCNFRAPVECWSMATRILSLVPGTNLRHLRLYLEHSEDENVFPDVHKFRWEDLRAICRPLIELESLDIQLIPLHLKDQQRCVDFELSEFASVFKREKYDGLPWAGRAGLLIDGKCQHTGCRSYNASRFLREA
ncbi:hypothetical protein BC629DRAFT_1439432 [Irpex lacteus]|nr:hypothetical protein BC629DRAFT_1439432 [Irpex lacteus]